MQTMLHNNAPTAEAPVGTILSDLVDSSQTFVRKEVELHKAEVVEKITSVVKEKGQAVGLLVGGGLFALLGLAFLGVTLFIGLQYWLAPWLSALVVTLLYFLVGGILAYMGKTALASSEPIEPEGV